jgi:hypothetical protein
MPWYPRKIVHFSLVLLEFTTISMVIPPKKGILEELIAANFESPNAPLVVSKCFGACAA